VQKSQNSYQRFHVFAPQIWRGPRQFFFSGICKSIPLPQYWTSFVEIPCLVFHLCWRILKKSAVKYNGLAFGRHNNYVYLTTQLQLHFRECMACTQCIRCGPLQQMTHTAWSVCVSVCWLHWCTVQNRLNPARSNLDIVLYFKTLWSVASSHCKWWRRHLLKMAVFSTFKGSWPWPWIGSYCIQSCITHRPIPTCQISLKSKKLFMGRRTYARTYALTDGHLRPALLCLDSVEESTKNHTSKFHEMSCTCYLQPSLGPSLTAMWYVMYFRFYGRHHVFI